MCFKINEWMVKTNHNVVGEQCIRNNVILAVSEEDKKIALKCYHEKLLNTEFALDKNSLSQANPANRVLLITDKEKDRQSISKMKNGKGCRAIRCNSVRIGKSSRRIRS